MSRILIDDYILDDETSEIVSAHGGTDERRDDYTFYASIGTQDKEATP